MCAQNAKCSPVPSQYFLRCVAFTCLRWTCMFDRRVRRLYVFVSVFELLNNQSSIMYSQGLVNAIFPLLTLSSIFPGIDPNSIWHGCEVEWKYDEVFELSKQIQILKNEIDDKHMCLDKIFSFIHSFIHPDTTVQRRPGKELEHIWDSAEGMHQKACRCWSVKGWGFFPLLIRI